MPITISNSFAYKLFSYPLTDKKQKKNPNPTHYGIPFPFPVFLFEYFLN